MLIPLQKSTGGAHCNKGGQGRGMSAGELTMYKTQSWIYKVPELGGFYMKVHDGWYLAWEVVDRGLHGVGRECG